MIFPNYSDVSVPIGTLLPFYTWKKHVKNKSRACRARTSKRLPALLYRFESITKYTNIITKPHNLFHFASHTIPKPGRFCIAVTSTKLYRRVILGNRISSSLETPVHNNETGRTMFLVSFSHQLLLELQEPSILHGITLVLARNLVQASKACFCTKYSEGRVVPSHIISDITS